MWCKGGQPRRFCVPFSASREPATVILGPKPATLNSEAGSRLHINQQPPPAAAGISSSSSGQSWLSLPVWLISLSFFLYLIALFLFALWFPLAKVFEDLN
jgi:hypothetical protein